MRFTDFLTEEELTEWIFKRRRKVEIPSSPPKPRDPEESPHHRFVRRFDEMTRSLARVTAHAYDARIDEQDLIDEMASIVRDVYKRKAQRAERKRVPAFRGEVIRDQ